jgi:hypothetical protein
MYVQLLHGTVIPTWSPHFLGYITRVVDVSRNRLLAPLLSCVHFKKLLTGLSF